MSKNFYFLSGLPRAGNTLLGSLINQHEDIKLSSNTSITEILFQLSMIKEHDVFKNFPDHQSLDNVINNVFNNFHKDWKANNVIIRGPWGTPANLSILKSLIKKPKFVILYRPVLECLSSFVKLDKPINLDDYCEHKMSKNGIIGRNLWSIENIIKQKENYIIVNYKEFILNPIKTIKDIFNFLNLNFINIDLNNIKQFQINNIKYDDSIYRNNLHTIRTDEIKVNKYKIEEYLPDYIIKKYKNSDIV